MSRKKTFKDNPALQFISQPKEEPEPQQEAPQPAQTPAPVAEKESQRKATEETPSERPPRLLHLDGIQLYTLTELEPVLGVTHRTLLTYVKTGRLKAVKIGGKWKVSGDVLRKFINGEP